MEIIVLGGGTAGYVTALILKEKYREKVNIKIIKSKDIGIIGVGEGTTEHWDDFLKFITYKKITHSILCETFPIIRALN